MEHPRDELIGYLSGELPPAARARVADHLAACAGCRAEAEAFRAILAGLRAGPPAPPALDWARYRAELRGRLEPRRAFLGWWRRPVPLALSATLAGVLAALAWLGGVQDRPRGELSVFEEEALGRHLELLRDWRVVERLDLLENLDVITQLDRLAPGQEG